MSAAPSAAVLKTNVEDGCIGGLIAPWLSAGLYPANKAFVSKCLVMQ